MRGCLFVLVAGAIAVTLAVVVGLPWAASGLVRAGLEAAGLEAADTTVTVSSDAPTDLVGLHADHVRVRATNAKFRGMAIGALDLALTDVDVLGRTAGGIDGTLTDVIVPVAGGPPVPVGSITIRGTGTDLTASTLVSGGRVEALIADAVTRETGRRPKSVTLSSPDRVAVDVGVTARGRFAVTPAGDLVIRVENLPDALDEVVLLRGGSDLPVRLTRVRVANGGDLRLDGVLEVGLLG